MFQIVRHLVRTTLQYVQGGTNTEGRGRSSTAWDRTTQGPAQQPASDILVEIQDTTKKAHILIREWRSVGELRELLASYSHTAEVVNARDSSGYTLLQHAIMCHRPDVVQWLVTQGAELNSPICGRPLHLAAKLGHTDILALLLDCNADPAVVSCVCYPDKHVDARTVYSSHGKRWYVTCPGDVFNHDTLMEHQFEFPLYFAILSDSVDCVKILLDRDMCQMKTSLPSLHLACSKGALHCAQYFCHHNKGQLAQKDTGSLVPLQHGVKWGKAMVEFLVLKGASVLVKTNANETLLHLLFQRPKACAGLADTASYLLDCGLKVNINAMDNGGNSALNTLLLTLHKQVPERARGMDPDPGLSREEWGFYDAMCQLLEAGINPNIANRVGDTSLHILSRVLCQPAADCTVQQLAQPTYTSLRLVYMMFDRLLSMGANPNLVNNSEGTVLGMLVCHATNAMFSEGNSESRFVLPDESDLQYLVLTIRLLKKHRCDFHSCRYVGSGCLLHIALGHLGRLDDLSHCHYSVRQETQLATTYTCSILSIVQVLLESGFRPNACRSLQTDLHSLYYQLISKWKILPMCTIQDFLLLLLRHGADPNIGGKHVPMSVFRYRSTHCYWPVFPLLHIMNLLGSREMVAIETELLALMHVFYNAMEESNAKQCILHYLEYDRLRSRCAKYPQFDQHLMDLLSSPASLRRMCASYVYSSLAERRVDRLVELNVPTSLVRYIGNFQYEL